MSNVLSFVTENVELAQGDGQGSYLAFVYIVDGKRIEDEEYNPADCYDVIDEYAEKQNLVVLNHCSCGVWGCSSRVAKVSVEESRVIWNISELRSPSCGEQYIFDREQYKQVISAIRTCALEEIEKHDKERETQITIRMEPDYDSLFIYESGCDISVLPEESIGTDEYVTLNGQTIYFHNPCLKEWNNKYVQKVLIPCESNKSAIDEINRNFDWKEFHKTGIRLAMEVKKLLPDNVILKYSAPYEDRSGLIKEPLGIDEHSIEIVF